MGLVVLGGEARAQEELDGDAGVAEGLDGVALFEQARFEEAQAWFERALAAPDADDGALTRAHLYLAALALAVGDQEAAEAHVAAAATLDPTATPPPGAPPEIASMLRIAAATVPPGGLAIEMDGSECRSQREPVRVRASLTTAPPGLVASLTLRCEAGGTRAAEVQQPASATADVEIEPDVIQGQALTCEATARSAGDATLRTAELRIPLCGGNGRTWRERMNPWGWVGVGGGAAALVTMAIVLAAVLSRPDTADVGAAELVVP